jgi:hypothetical protein
MAQNKKGKFLDQFGATGLVGKSAEAVGIGRRTVYNWLDNDPEFHQQFEYAREQFVEMLEAEAKRRACDGVDKPIFYQGQLVETVKEYSDTLMIFLLKANAPDKYRERVEHSGEGGGPIEHVLKVVYEDNHQRNPDSPP